MVSGVVSGRNPTGVDRRQHEMFEAKLAVTCRWCEPSAGWGAVGGVAAKSTCSLAWSGALGVVSRLDEHVARGVSAECPIPPRLTWRRGVRR